MWDRREKWLGHILMADGDRVFAAWKRGSGPERAGSVPAGHDRCPAGALTRARPVLSDPAPTVPPMSTHTPPAGASALPPAGHASGVHRAAGRPPGQRRSSWARRVT